MTEEVWSDINPTSIELMSSEESWNYSWSYRRNARHL